MNPRAMWSVPCSVTEWRCPPVARETVTLLRDISFHRSTLAQLHSFSVKFVAKNSGGHPYGCWQHRPLRKLRAFPQLSARPRHPKTHNIYLLVAYLGFSTNI